MPGTPKGVRLRDAREGLLGCIGELIDTRFGGRIAKRYMIELAVAYRHPAA